MSLAAVRSGQFKRDVKRLAKRGKDLDKLAEVLRLLLAQAPLPSGYRDHPLRGNWGGFRDLHLEPDWVLIYRTDADAVYLARTGTHADVFDE